jgi:Mg2+ and Co2+ transporter CorA
MQYSQASNGTANKNDEALAKEFAEYISVVSDSIVRSQIKHDFSAIEKLIETVSDKLAPMQETAQLSTSIAHQLKDVQSKLVALREQWQAALHSAIDDLSKKQQGVFEITTTPYIQKVSALQRAIDDLGTRQQSVLEKTTNSYSQKISSLTDGLTRQLQNDTNRYLESLSQTPAAIAELGVTVCRSVEDRSKEVSEEVRKTSSATESGLRSLVEKKAFATSLEIATCSKNVDEASARIQSEVRSKTERIATDIGEAQKSLKTNLETISAGLKVEIAQFQEIALAAIKEADAQNNERANKINGRMRHMLDQMSKTDQRILTMQKWIWGLGGSCLLALLVLLFKVIR